METKSKNDPTIVYTDQEGQRHVIPGEVIEQYRAEEDEKARAMTVHAEDCVGVYSPDDLAKAEKLAAEEVEHRHHDC